MILYDEMKVRVKKIKAVSRRTGEEKEYSMYFVVFSTEYSNILKDVKVLKNVEIITKEKKYVLAEAKVYKHCDYKRKNGERIPLYAIVIPKKLVGEELMSKGIRKVKVIAEIPEVNNNSTENQAPNQTTNASVAPDATGAVVAQTPS